MNLQPSARDCFVCGVQNAAGLHIRFYENTENPPHVFAECTVPARFQGYPGIVHGGILATMLDEVISRTIFRGAPPRTVVTARLSLRYRRPVAIETPLHLEGWVVEDKGKIVLVAGKITGSDGTLLTEAEAVLMEVSPDSFGPPDPQDWQIYPESTGDQDDSGISSSKDPRGSADPAA